MDFEEKKCNSRKIHIAHRFGQAALVHVLVAGSASLPASTGVVHGPRGAGHPISVMAGVGGVVGAVGMMVVMVVAAGERAKCHNKEEY